MMSPLRTMLAATVATIVVISSVSDAFAIRNRYTNRQAQGFAAYFFNDYREPYRYADGGDDGYFPADHRYGSRHAFRRHQVARPFYGDDEGPW